MRKNSAALRLESDGFDYDVSIEPEQETFRGHFGYDTEAENKKAEQWIADQLDAGNDYAWCWVSVTATERSPKPGFMARTGNDAIGCCSYKSRADIEKHLIADMKSEARTVAHSEPPRLHPEAAKVAYAYLMAERTTNYGYDHADFRRISNQRSRARNAMRLVTSNGEHPERLNWHAVGDRLSFKQDPNNGTWSAHYIVGQSQNEEITNLLRRLVNPESKWQS